jgi:DNA replication licensing factor MCM7
MAGNSTRESVSRNAVVIAREAVQRAPQHKELIRKFIKSWEVRTGEPDGRFGFQKYKALLRRAVNRHIDTVHVDLNDVQEFCRKELQNGDEALNIQMTEAVEKLISDIESNTMRYMRYFYNACDFEQPEKDDDFNMENTALAKDAINRWRERSWTERQTGAEGATGQAPPMPQQMKNDWEVRFKPRSDAKILKLRDITSSYVGSLVQMDCLVVRISQVKPKVEVVTYTCEVCGAEIFQSVEGENYTPPKECPSQRCQDNKQAGKLNSNVRTCKFVKYQELRVQEMADHVPVGGVPRSVNVVVFGDLTRSVLPGDAITLAGVYTPYQLPWFQARTKGTMQEMFIEAHSIRKHKSGYNEEAVDEASMNQKLNEAGKKGNLYDSAAKSIAPEIFGHVDVKKALLLVLVGSFTKTMKDGMKIRGDIHTLLMGDPGVAKSQLLKQAINIAPRSVYTTGKGSSGVGLTASVVRDSMTGEVSLEGGALVLADMGVCCIDEFDKMEEGDRSAIHEVMEQQSVSIAKAGITTSLNCRTTVLAAANPVYGRYNPYKSPVENIDLPAALLSRFDLLFLLLDTVDADKDKNLAQHVCKVHSNYNGGAVKADKMASESATPEGDVLNLGFTPFDGHFMRSLIRRARTFEPMIDNAIQRDIVDAYVAMRDDEKRGDVDSRKSYTTPRTLLAILRLSQAHARVRFSEKVERQDFEEAMRLMKVSKESVELSSPAKRDANPLDLVHDIVADLAKRSAGGDDWVDLQHVVSMAGHKALTREMCIEAIDNWESLNILCFNPEKTMVKFMVPPA